MTVTNPEPHDVTTSPSPKAPCCALACWPEEPPERVPLACKDHSGGRA